MMSLSMAANEPGNVFYMDSLAFPRGHLAGLEPARKAIPLGSIDVLMTNPPFGHVMASDRPQEPPRRPPASYSTLGFRRHPERLGGARAAFAWRRGAMTSSRKPVFETKEPGIALLRRRLLRGTTGTGQHVGTCPGHVSPPMSRRGTDGTFPIRDVPAPPRVA
jgi:hypothetical protein